MRSLWVVPCVLSLLAGCSLNRAPIFPEGDAGGDAGMDGGDGGPRDTGPDVPELDGGPLDGGLDGGDDAATDTGIDAPELDGGTDAPIDTGVDAPSDSGVDAPTDAGVDAPCVPSCADDFTLQGCAGSVGTMEMCELGCYETPAPHCAEMVPANVSAAYATAPSSGGAVVVSADALVNTATCVWDGATDYTGSVVAMDGGGNVCLFVFDSLTIEAPRIVYAFGALPLVIVSRGDIDLGGAVSVDSARSLPPPASGAVTGAGSGTGGVAGGNGGNNGVNDGGGGGGGFGGGGGSGGAGGGSTSGSAGTGALIPLIPLRGGARGGDGASDGGDGGAGGGVFQITALGRFTIRASAYLGASGAGGAGGGSGVSAGAGGGGGSGGGILLEGRSFTIAGGIVNIAGGGGGGGGCLGGSGGAGGDGIDAPTARASGGSTCGGGTGGAGSGGMFQNGTNGAAGDNNGGGGGGGAGQVVFRVPDAALPLPGSATFNPTHGSSALRYTVGDVSRR